MNVKNKYNKVKKHLAINEASIYKVDKSDQLNLQRL